ncbi:hypothetical protein F5884DRAFT_850713 [Xylogone sp. PMI_703]|nr:hypothetical protein F5884DRAFT_850713 [Xylogone sp. PMI_703]
MISLLTILAPTLVSAAALMPRSDHRAAYFLDNNPAGSSIVSLKIDINDGTLSDPVRTSTGGVGMYALAGAAPGGADTLFTQDSVVVSEDYLFTVNAGSNTVSMFFINQNDPYHPTLVGKPVSSGGEFPASIAYSSKLKTACVVNGGKVAGVACFHADHAKGLTPLGGLREIPLNQTTPPVGSAGTVGDIVFNPSGTAVFATVKGNGAAPGYFYVYPVELDGQISTKAVVSQPQELVTDWSLNFLGEDSKAAMSDPAYGVSLLDISWDFKVSVADKITIPAQKAICWTAYAPRFDSVYGIDGANPLIFIIDPKSGAVKDTIQGDATYGGFLDSKPDRTWLYAARGQAAVSVVSLSGSNSGKAPTIVQTLNLTSLGSRQGWQGMAIYPNSA